jgi:hypothetical protein
MECPTLCGQFKAALDRIGSRHRFSVSKKRARRKPDFKQSKARSKEKRAGRKPCSKNCVDPISPKIWI